MKDSTANIIGMGVVLMFAGLVALVAPRPMASNDEANAFVAAQLEKYKSPRKMTQQEALYEVWNLTEADVARPVELIFSKSNVR